MSTRRPDRWPQAAQAWGQLNDTTARVVVWVDEEGVPRIVARGRAGEVTLLASPTWETIAELLLRAAQELRNIG